MNYLKIVLQRPSDQAGQFKEIYRNSVPFNMAVRFPFESVVSTLRFLYPYDDLIINFTLI